MNGRVRLVDGTELDVRQGAGTIWGGEKGGMLDPRVIREFQNSPDSPWYPVKRPGEPAPAVEPARTMAAERAPGDVIRGPEPAAPARLSIVKDTEANRHVLMRGDEELGNFATKGEALKAKNSANHQGCCGSQGSVGCRVKQKQCAAI